MMDGITESYFEFSGLQETVELVAVADVTVVVPTLNPGPYAAPLILALRGQTIRPSQVIILDSESTDGSDVLFRRAGFKVRSVSRSEFDHGGTRNLGLEIVASGDVVVFMTQDALPASVDWLRNLIEPFRDPRMGVVYARQLPRLQAGPIESHARYFNYPEASRVRSMPDANTLGIKAVFNSNACAAYRRQALADIGGFPPRVILGEDQIAAGRMLLAGWKVAYEATAQVIHSHAYSVSEEFRRYFDIGVLHRDHRELLAPFGKARSEGKRFVISEMRYLLHRRRRQLPEALVRTATKYLAYSLGKRHQVLPRQVKRMLAMNPAFFKAEERSRGSRVQATPLGIGGEA